MTSLYPLTPALVTGQRMSREEFLRVWEQMPGVKNAELIDGVVYVSSPVSLDHSEFDGMIHWWLGQYAAFTPGVRYAPSATWLMLESAPQPEAALRILPECWGQSTVEGKYAVGAPELAVEICLASTEVDFGPKLALYQRAGVREYMTIELFVKRIAWRELFQGAFRYLAPAADGSLRSQVFPGLWLDEQAFWKRDEQRMLATLERGLKDSAHAAFVARMQS